MLKNCNFYCCDTYKNEYEAGDYFIRHNPIKFCPYCGAKLR